MKFVSVIMAVCLGLAASGCDEDKADQEAPEYYPLSVGDYWKYRETYDEPGHSFEFRREVTGFETMDLGEELGTRDVYIVENRSDKWGGYYKIYLTEDNGERATRLRQSTPTNRDC